MKPKSLRRAAILNLIWPGMGQLYLGQWRFGGILAGSFAVCFLIVAVIFLNGMRIYIDLSTSGHILEGDNLEKIGGAFTSPWLLAMTIAGVILFIISLAGLHFAPPEAGEPPTAPPILPPLLPK